MKRVTALAIAQLLAFIGAVGVCAAFPLGYTLEQSGTGFAALSAEQFLSPSHSVKMGTVLGADKAAIVFNGDSRLNSIATLSYWTYTVGAGTAGQLTAWVGIYLHTQPNKTYADWVADYGASSPDVFYIQAEPYYATGPPVLNTWQEQNAFSATPLTWVGLESPDYPHDAPALADYISGAALSWPVPGHGNQAFASREYGTLYVVAMKIRMGYGGPWVDTLAYVDDVTVNDYFEQFEPWTPVPTLSEWGMMVFITLTGLVAIYLLRRKRQAA